MQKPSVAVASADRLFERLTKGSPGLRIPLVSAGRTSSAGGVVALPDVPQRPKLAVEVISVLQGKGVVGLSVGNIIVKCLAVNAAKKDLGAEMVFMLWSVPRGTLLYPRQWYLLSRRIRLRIWG
jgi:hypothetical protein